MATETDTGMSTGMVVGILVVLLVVVVLVVMGIGGTNDGGGTQTAPNGDAGMQAPAMPTEDAGDEVNQEVNLPDPEFNVPDEVDVNVNEGQQQ